MLDNRQKIVRGCEMRTNYAFRNLAAEMARNGVTPDDVASVLHCSRNNVYQKLRGKVMFNIKDMLEIQNLMNSKGASYSLDYLFDDSDESND